MVVALALLCGSGSAFAAPTYCNDRDGLTQVVNERKAWTEKLTARKFAELENFFGGLQRAYEAGVKTDAEVAAWFAAFNQPGSRLTPHLEEWVAKYPDSYAAKLALARHLFALAWENRGDKLAARTSGTQFAAMQRELERMIDVLNKADQQTRKPIVSYVLRVDLAKTLVGPKAVLEEFEKAERIDPLNSVVKTAFIYASAPKWGGDSEALERFLRTVAGSSLPADLKTFVEYQHEMMEGDAAWVAGKREVAIATFERAARLCTAYVAPYEELLRLYKDADNAQGVISAAEGYLSFFPNSGWAYAKLGSAQARMKRDADSFRSYERAAQLGDRTGAEGLAWHYARGEAVKRDPAKALELYTQVYDRGGTHVKVQIDRLRQELGK